MTSGLPILISIPHGGVSVPPEAAGRVTLGPLALQYYSDPASTRLFGFDDRVRAHVSTPISRVIVDLNRPPYHLPPGHRDGVVKYHTSLGFPIWKEGQQPNIQGIHLLLLRHYFPYHAEIDRLLDSHGIAVALDCHCMVPVGLPGQPDEGKERPLVCLGNNGDHHGNPKKGALSTCPPDWIKQLAERFRDHFPGQGSVTMNQPFSGGFISNAHYWHKGVPWIQVEVNRSLYESRESSPENGSLVKISLLEDIGSTLWEVLAQWYSDVVHEDPASMNPGKPE
ncbi:MAG: N-formylglutamate amidohydrolase [Methanolinea sp.]|jgi:formiminoglutamase|nr:N-formylglutamate amidohydrolase [Methanolinea sp.]